MQAPVVPTQGSEPRARRATIAEWLAEPEERGAELIGGRLVYKAAPGFDHGQAQGYLREQLGPFARRPGDGERPGGWWLGLEVDMELGGDGVRPDVAGWRRDRHASRPQAEPGGAVTAAPDWIGEVLSPSTASRDLGVKMAIYHRAEIGHYWVIDPLNRALSVYRWTKDGYVLALAAGAKDKVRAPPFEALELEVGLLFGDDEVPPAPAEPNEPPTP